MDVIKKGKEVLQIEIDALKNIMEKIDDNFSKAIDILYNCKGRVIVTGVGKSGLIGRKIAATFSSTGTPAFFLHPTEGIHGDLGIVTSKDVVMIISNSGNTQELTLLIPFFKRMGVKIISLVGNKESEIAKNSDAIIDVSVEKEAGPIGLIPTSSTTGALAVGDALAVVLLSKRNFKEEDFALLHPGGSIGKKLILKVRDVMCVKEKNPIISEEKTLKEAIIEMTSQKVGVVSVIDSDKKLAGIFTDGDLRRWLRKEGNVLDKKLGEIMTRNPKVITEDQLAVKAAKIMEDNSITVLPVIDKDNRPYAMVHLHDLMRAGVV